MDIVKKNLAAIILGIVILLALVVPVWPLGGYKSSLESRLEGRTSVYRNLETLMRKNRQTPVVDPDHPAQQALEGFPGDKTIESGRQVTEKVTQQAAEVAKAAILINQRPLLVPESLPQPNDQTRFEFRNKYLNEAMAVTIPTTILKAGRPPTPEEINRRAEELWKTKYEPMIPKVNNEPVREVAEEQKRRFEEEKKTLPLTEPRRVAESFMVYLESTALTYQPGITPTETPDPEKIWFAQLGYWIQEDVAEAIAATNANASRLLDNQGKEIGPPCVLTAPVKHIIRIDIPQMPYLLPSGAIAGAIPAEPTAPVMLHNDLSPSGRTSNGLYDVCLFNLTVVVEASQVPRLLQELTKDRFMAVMKMNMTAEDAGVRATQGYLYGSDPVVLLELQMETAFLRSWTKPLMPERVQQLLGLIAGPVDGLGGPGGPGGPGGFPGGPGGPGGFPGGYPGRPPGR